MAVRSSPRRSISIALSLHERLSEHCRLHGIALSAFVEALVSERLQPAPNPAPPPVVLIPVDPLPPKKRPKMRPAFAPMLALPPQSEVHMPALDGPLLGYIPPIQNW